MKAISLFLSPLSVFLNYFLSFHHGEGDEEGRGGGAADEEGHAPGDEGHEDRQLEREGNEGDEGHEGRERVREGDEGDEGHEGRECEREGDEGDEGHEGREREREGDEGDEGHEVSWRGVIGAWAWLRRVVVSTSLLSVGQEMQLNLCR